MSFKNNQILNVFDLDGTLFDDRWRLDRIKKSDPYDHDYDDYHSGILEDDPWPLIVSHAIAAITAGEDVEYWTARPSRYHEQSLTKLGQTLPGARFIMRMRIDKRSSVLMKINWLHSVMQYNKYRFINVFDDRQDIISAMREEAVKYNSTAKHKISFTFNLCKEGKILQQVGIDPSATGKEETKVAEVEQSPATAADILDAMAATFRERNAVYGDNAVMVGQVMQVLFPNGVTLKTPEDYHMWHLFELKIVKLTRFAISGLKHEDSIHDDGVYSAMCERLVNTHNINFNK